MSSGKKDVVEAARKRILVQIRVSPIQKRILVDAAAVAGLELSSWLRALAIKEAHRLGVK